MPIQQRMARWWAVETRHALSLRMHRFGQGGAFIQRRWQTGQTRYGLILGEPEEQCVVKKRAEL